MIALFLAIPISNLCLDLNKSSNEHNLYLKINTALEWLFLPQNWHRTKSAFETLGVLLPDLVGLA